MCRKGWRAASVFNRPSQWHRVNIKKIGTMMGAVRTAFLGGTNQTPLMTTPDVPSAHTAQRTVAWPHEKGVDAGEVIGGQSSSPDFLKSFR